MFGRACGRLGIRVEDPQWVELPNDRPDTYIQGIQTDVTLNTQLWL